jgi:hypothetical protein
MGCVPEFVLSAVASTDGRPDEGRHVGGQKAETHDTINASMPRLTFKHSQLSVMSKKYKINKTHAPYVYCIVKMPHFE